MLLYKAVNPLHRLPKHWIKYLAERYGKIIGYYKELAGENSDVKELPTFDVPTIRNALKDDNVIAIIGRKEGEPIFMLTRHYEKSSKYMIFEVEPGRGKYNSKKSKYYAKNDDFTIQEIMDIIEEMIADKNFENITIETISIDTKRIQKAEYRTKLRSIIDPYQPIGYEPYDKRPLLTTKQRDLIKKYAEVKRPKLDKKLEEEIEKIKKKIIDNINQSLSSIENDIKKGYTYNITKRTIGDLISRNLDTTPLERLASAYGIFSLSYSSKDKPGDIANKLKLLDLQ